ncbi:MAG: cyclohexanecarboxyl-CoA dehydrogenase, partial [Burkholderiaceae bacterium]
QGLGCLAAGVIHEEIARADLSISYINLLASLNGQILSQHGQPGMVKPWLERLVRGEALFAIALTEPRGGSDAGNLRLRFERIGNEYVVNGEKASISAADQADAAIVFGRTGSVESAARGITALLIPMDLPGITTNRFDCHGQRAIGRGSIFFENVRVPATYRLGDENQGFAQVMQGFDFSRALIGLQVLAVARVALEEAWDYVAQREAFGKPLSAFQGVSHPLAELDTQVGAARLLCLQTLWLKDRGAPHGAEAAMCKWWAPKLAYDAVHQCLLSFGHGGYDRGVMEQRLRDVLGFQIGDGTAQIMKTIVARARAGRAAVGV